MTSNAENLDGWVALRLEPSLLDAVDTAAQARGITRSEMIRQTLRDGVGNATTAHEQILEWINGTGLRLVSEANPVRQTHTIQWQGANVYADQRPGLKGLQAATLKELVALLPDRSTFDRPRQQTDRDTYADRYTTITRWVI